MTEPTTLPEAPKATKRLWDLPRGARFTIVSDLTVPPDAPPVDHSTIYQLVTLDGLYSYCHDPDSNVVHISVGAEVQEIV